MANEKRATGSFQVGIGALLQTLTVSFTGDLTGQPSSLRQQIATGSWQALQLSAGLASIERIMVKNEDATNYVEFSYASDGSNPIAKVVKLDWFYIAPPAGTTAIYARANTAACWISFNACEP